MPFTELGLSDKVLSAVDAAGYTEPTPIQAQAIPHVLAKRDLIGIAQTGTGKTASFVLPMLSLLERGRARARMPRTLILEPTRELAAQVEQNFIIYGQNHKLTVALLIGGVSFDEQNKKLDRGADVLIATPGRMLDHFERGRLLLTGVEILVIDEADRMLDMGFIPDIERICRLVPPGHQTLFFSATMPPEIQKLTGQFLNDPVQVAVARQSTVAETVQQKVVPVAAVPKEKRATLRAEIRAAGGDATAIVFCNRKRDVATLQRSLLRHGFNAGALHGDMDQHQRMATLDGFRSGQITILVASDVAARGLDIPAVTHVFNFDVPTHAEDYIHRIGRTGRAGRSGNATTLVASSERKYLDSIEKMLGKSIPRSEDAGPATEEDAGDLTAEKPAAQEGRSRRRKRSGRGGGASRQSEASHEAVEAPSSPEPAPEPRKAEHSPRQTAESRPARRRGRGGKGRERGEAGSKDGGDEPVVGLGDHVPSFLLRPTRPPRDR